MYKIAVLYTVKLHFALCVLTYSCGSQLRDHKQDSYIFDYTFFIRTIL